MNKENSKHVNHKFIASFFINVIIIIILLITPAIALASHAGTAMGAETSAGAASTGTLTEEQRQAIESVVRDSTSQIWFEKNVGQFAEGALYGFRTAFGSMLVYNDHLQILTNQIDPANSQAGVHAVNMSFVGGNAVWQIVPGGLSGVMGTYQNSDGTASHPDIFKELTLRNVYNGVDLRLYSAEQGTLEFDWLVARAQDYQKIQMAFSGQDGIAYDADGAVTLDLRYQNLTLKMPETYQVIDGVKHSITARMMAGDSPNEMRYELSGEIVMDQPLVIDPSIAWSTYIDLNHTTYDSYVFAVAVNGNGVYAGGWMREIVTNATYGGTGRYMEVNAGYSIGTAANQNYIYRLNNIGRNITAWTSTGVLTDPAITAAVNQKFNSATNDAVSDLALFPDGRVLIGFNSGILQIYAANLATRSYSGEPVTMDTLNSVAIKDDNSFYAGGRVAAAVPTGQIPGANIGPDAAYAGGTLGLEGVIIRYSSATTTPAPDWATYIGGSGDEYFTAIDMTPDKTNLVFAATTAVAGTYPALVNAVDATIVGTTELLVGVLSDGAAKPSAFSVFSYLGGDTAEGSLSNATTAAVVTAADSYFYVAGNTNSAAASMPGITGGAQTTNGGGNFDAFISRIPIGGGPTGFQTTFIGGNTEEDIGGIAYDTEAEQLLVFGTTTSGFPVLNTTPASNYYDGVAGGGLDIFITIFSSDLTSKIYATYIGANLNDYLGSTGDLIGQGHVVYSSDTGLTYLATTVHSNLPTSAIGLPGGKDTSANTAGNDSHTIFAFNINSYDFGDASASFEGSDAANSAISTTIRIGASVDAEAMPDSGATALGDDIANTGSADDEDGIASLHPLFVGSTTYSNTVSVLNNSGATRTLQGWVDVNLNGVFEVGEYASVSVPNNASQQNATLTWSGLSVPGVGQSYLRLRLNNGSLTDNAGTPNMDERSIGYAVSGEVEDYALTIAVLPPSISKSFSPNQILTGGTSVLTFTITNPDLANAQTDAVFSDTFPAAMTVANPTGVSTSGCGSPTFAPVVGAGSISFTDGTIPAGGTCVVTVNVTATSTGTNTSGNVSSTSGGTGNASSDTLTVIASPTGCLSNQTLATWNFDALAVGTNTAPAYASKAGDVNGGITVAAAGSGLATSTIAANGNTIPNNWESLSDFQAPIPANSYFEFTVDATKYKGLGMSFAMRRINTSGPTTVNVQYSVDGAAFASFATYTNIPNGAYVTNNAAFGAALDNSTSNVRVRLYPSGATNNSRVVRLDDVTFTGCRILQLPSMTKAFSPTTIPAGGTSTLTFTLSNPNVLDALSGTAFTDIYPTNVVNDAAPAVNNSCGGSVTATPGDGGISLVGGSIPANGSCTVTVNVTSDTVGTYNNTSGNVSSIYGGSGSTPATSTLGVTGVADLGVTKTDGILTVVSSQTVTYTLTVTNTGTITATGIALKDTIPSNLTYNSGTCGTPSINGAIYTFTLADLAAGASTNCTVTMTVAGSLSDGTLISNYARVTTTAAEPNITNNEMSDIDTVQSTMVPDLQVTKTHSHATPLLAGDTITYTIAYTNAGQAATTGTGVVITDNLPSNASYVSSNPAGTLVGSTLTWNVGNLGIGASGSIEVVVTVNSDLLVGAAVLNRVSIAGPDGIDYNLMDNTATDSDVVVAPYVVIEKSVTGDSYIGGVLTYNIHWENISTASAANVSITDAIPANTTLVPGSISSPGSESGGTITWNLGTKSPGDSGTVSFQVTVGSGAGGDAQTGPTLSAEAGAGTVTVISKTSAYTSLPWCDSTYNPDCLTYSGIYQGPDSVGPTGWNDNPRATAFNDASWTQPFAAEAETAYWLNASVLSAEWTSVHTGHQLQGTIDVVNGSADITGTGTNFTGELAVNRYVTIEGAKYRILTISSATSMTLTTNYAGITANGIDFYSDGEVDPNYAFYRQAFCTPLNASNLDGTLSLASDDTSFIFLNGVSLGQHTGAGAYSTFSGATGIQSGINILSIRLQNNTHGGHAAFGGGDHSGLLFNLQASFNSLRPFAYAPSMILAGQTVTFTIDENALGDGGPYSYRYDWGDGTSAVDYTEDLTTTTHTYTTPGTYVATVTARAQYGCTGTDQVTINALQTGAPVNSRILANAADISYENLNSVPYSGESGAGIEMDMGTLTGVVYDDANRNGIFDDGELGISAVTVTLKNALGAIVSNLQTDVNGVYSFSNLASGTYSVTETDPGGYNSTGDTQGANDNVVDNIAVTAGATSSDNNFFDAPILNNPTLTTMASPTTGTTGIGDTFGDTATVSGGDNPTGSVTFTLYSDSSCTSAVSGMSGSGVISAGEASWSSSWIPPLAGTYYWKASYSGDTNNNPYTTGCLDANEQITITDPPRNFGHLPTSTYPSNLFADGGAWSLTGDTYLGDSVTTATDGINDGTYTPKASDDGVTNTPNVLWTVAGGGSVDLIVTCPSAPCYLNAWIDFNQNGNINNTGEQIFTNQAVSNGNNSALTFIIPAGTVFDGTRSYARFRLTNQPVTDPLPYGVLLNDTVPLVGEIEDIYFEVSSDGTTTPVTVSYFMAERQDDIVNFTWSTATETGNIGFNLYADNGSGKRIRLNRELIPSNSVDSLDQQDYTYSAKTARDIFYIEDVNILRETRLHGPFTLGEEYGARVIENKIDWDSIQDERTQMQADRQHSITIDMVIPEIALEADLDSVAGESSQELPDEDSILTPDTVVPEEDQPADTLEISPDLPLTELDASRIKLLLTTTLNLKVHQTGIYRITYEMLRDAGFDLAGVSSTRITLTNRGRELPVYMRAKNTFGPGSYIEFYGQALDTIYTDTNIYTLQLSRLPVTRIPLVDGQPVNGSPSGFYTETLVVNNQRSYANYAPGNDAWYDTEMLAFTTPKTWSFPFQVDGLNVTAPASLELVVWGVTDWPQSPDHHLRVSVNGVSLTQQTFDGLVEQKLKIDLPAGLLQEGTNTLQLTLPGDTGVEAELITLDQFSVMYQRAFQARNGQLTFTAAGSGFKVTNLPGQNVVVYRLEKNHMVKLGRVLVQASGSTFAASFAGTPRTSTYLVTTDEALYSPVFEATRLRANLNQSAQYLIISHPNFMEGIQPLVQARQVQGLTVSVVDVNDLYTQFTYGVFDPQAIQKYIAYAVKNLGTQYVLLVGGDTYDYRNHLGVNSISFIPSLYTKTGPIANFVPADPLFADIDLDNVPDVAIGRFPVRSTNELNLMVNKTLAYSGKDYGRTAVFASDRNDGDISFKNISLALSSGLSSDWTVENIHLDDLNVVAARSQLIEAMNRGTALVTFTGHSGPQEWTFSNLFNIQNASTLTNAGRPFVVVQWGCWNNYYVDPIYNYLVQSFLLSGDRGAAAVLGATTLADSNSEYLLGQILTPRLTQPGMTLGQALQLSKSELAQTHPGLLDVLLGWSLMGDPALVIEP